MSTCILRALLDKLLTRDRLKRYGIVEQDFCVLCNSETETTHHLFFSCPYSSYIWSLCKLKLKLPPHHISLHAEAEEIKKSFSAKTKTYILSRLVLTVAVWHIWQERNRKIFQQEQLHKIKLFRRLYEDVLVLMQSCHWKESNSALEQEILSNWS